MWLRKCRLKCPDWVKLFPQKSHWYGFSPLWLSWCRYSILRYWVHTSASTEALADVSGHPICHWHVWQGYVNSNLFFLLVKLLFSVITVPLQKLFSNKSLSNNGYTFVISEKAVKYFIIFNLASVSHGILSHRSWLYQLWINVHLFFFCTYLLQVCRKQECRVGQTRHLTLSRSQFIILIQVTANLEFLMVPVIFARVWRENFCKILKGNM